MQVAHPAPRRGLRTVVATAALAALVVTPALAAHAAVAPDPVARASSSAGSFYPVPVTRLVGDSTGVSLRAGVPLRVPVLGRPGLPSAGVSAVVLNVTTVATEARTTLLTLRPGSGPLAAAGPVTSATVPGRSTRTSLVTVPLDPAGALDVVASSRAVVTIDLVGLYAADDTVVATLGASGGYQPSDPVRLLGPGVAASTSTGDAVDPTPAPSATVDPELAAPLPARGVRHVGVDLGSDTVGHVTALLLRVSVVSAPAPGAVTVAADTGAGSRASTSSPVSSGSPGGVVGGPTASDAPPVTTPTLSLDRGVTASNLVVVPALVDDEGLIRVTVSSGLSRPVPVRVDLVGFYDDGALGADLRFRAVPGTRVLDTRTGGSAAPLPASGRRLLRPPAAVVGDNTFALVGSLTTLTRPGGPTEVAVRRVDPGAAATPATVAGSVAVAESDQATTPLQAEVGASGGLVLTASGGPAEVVLDVVGSFEAYPAVEDPALRDWVHAVPSWQVRAVAR